MTEPKVTSRQVYELKIKSLTSKPVTEFLPEIQRAASALASRLAGPESTLDVKIDRQKTIALDPLTIIILIEVVNLTAKPLIEGFFNRLGEKLADSITDDVDDVVVTPNKAPKSAKRR
jgi:hypothetical protein